MRRAYRTSGRVCSPMGKSVAWLNQAFLSLKNRILADGGEIDSQSDLNSYIIMAKANGVYDSIEFGMLGAYNIRTSGNTKYVTKAYSLDAVPNDATQTTEALQPFLSGNIAPNEKWGLKNPSGSSRLLNIPSLTVTGTITKVEMTGLTGKVLITHTDVVSQNITSLIPDIFTGAYFIRNQTLNANQKSAEATKLRQIFPEIPSVQIGTQRWATSNCEMVATPQGNIIPEVTDNATWADSQNIYDTTYAATVGTDAEKEQAALEAAAMWCYYNNDPSLGAIYGKLYNWFAVKLLQNDIDAYNLANPSTPWGWHVPSQAEFNALATALGGASVAGGKMKVVGTDYWSNPNTGANNSSGASVLGPGRRSNTGFFNGLGTIIKLYSQTSTWQIANVLESLVNSFDGNSWGYSLRLIKD